MNRLTRSLGVAALIVATAAGTLAVTDPAPAAVTESGDFRLTAFPVPYPHVDFWNSFGAARSGGRSHQGIDLMGDKGWPIYAVADGFVIRADRSPRAGYHIYLRHVGGWESWYMHLNNDTPGTDDGRNRRSLAFAEGIELGAFVKAGQLIGWMGDSGNAEGKKPHLHFELHDGDRVVNPYRYLAKAWRRQLRTWDMADLAQ